MFGFTKALVLTTLIASFASAAPSQQSDDSLIDWPHLNALLDTIDSNALHSVLHNLSPKFRDGVFSKDRAAIEHVHSENPVIASKLVYIAKRQNNGTTTGDAVAPDSTPTTVAPVAAPVSEAVSSLITQTDLPDPTTVLVAPSTAAGEIPIETISGAVVYSTQGGGVVTRTSSAVGVRFTRSTSTQLFYSTAADGTVSTSTSLVVVNAPVTETAVPTGAAGAAATSGDPGLQNGANHEQIGTGLLAGGLVAVAGFFAL